MVNYFWEEPNDNYINEKEIEKNTPNPEEFIASLKKNNPRALKYLRERSKSIDLEIYLRLRITPLYYSQKHQKELDLNGVFFMAINSEWRKVKFNSISVDKKNKDDTIFCWYWVILNEEVFWNQGEVPDIITFLPRHEPPQEQDFKILMTREQKQAFREELLENLPFNIPITIQKLIDNDNFKNRQN
jgi:hypothetical protein